MESTFQIKLSELDVSFIEAIKKLFNKDREIQITISSSSDFDLNKPETKDEYFDRLQKAVANLEGKKQIVKLSEDDLDKFSMNQIVR